MMPAFSHPEPDENGCLSVPLPCGHLDELIEPGRMQARSAFITTCPLCWSAFSVTVISQAELTEIGGLDRWAGPSGWTVAMASAGIP